MTRAKGPGESPLLLLDVIEILNRHQIPYAVIGALAASFYGVVRVSNDADAVVSLRLAGADIQTLLQGFQKAGLKTTHRMGDLSDQIGAVINVEDSYDNRVDLLMDIRGMEEEVFSRTIQAKLEGAPVRIVGMEDFIAMKLFAAGPQDLIDVAEALKVSGSQFDKTLLKKLAQGYGKETQRRLEALLKS